MSIIVKKAKPKIEYTQIANCVARDMRLSHEARGVLLYIQSLPNGASFQLSDLMQEKTDQHPSCQRDKLQRIMKELRLAGYATLVRTAKGSHYEASADPQSDTCDNNLPDNIDYNASQSIPTTGQSGSHNTKEIKDSKTSLSEKPLQGDGKKQPPPVGDIIAIAKQIKKSVLPETAMNTTAIKPAIDNPPVQQIEEIVMLNLNTAQEILLMVLTRAWMKESTIKIKADDISWLLDLVDIGLVEQKTVASGKMYKLTDKGYRVKNPPTEPGRKEENDRLVKALSAAYGTSPAGKDYGNYIRVARDLLEAKIIVKDDLWHAGIIEDKFKSYMKYIREIADEQGGWTVTINSLTTNNRMSEYRAKRAGTFQQGAAGTDEYKIIMTVDEPIPPPDELAVPRHLIEQWIAEDKAKAEAKVRAAVEGDNND